MALNLFNRNQKPAPVAAPAEEFLREDFTLDLIDAKSIIVELRTRTIDFADENGLTWAATDFEAPAQAGTVVPVRVKLTTNWDVVYIIAGQQTFQQREAIAWLAALQSDVMF